VPVEEAADPPTPAVVAADAAPPPPFAKTCPELNEVSPPVVCLEPPAPIATVIEAFKVNVRSLVVALAAPPPPPPVIALLVALPPPPPPPIHVTELLLFFQEYGTVQVVPEVSTVVSIPI
jgi:hypothetical protein